MSEEKYFYNLTTGEVEQGKVADMSRRMGPYDTREEAAAALEKAQKRTEEWAEDDARWEENWGSGR